MEKNIYVLKLENEKYYVGKTSNVNNRILNHFEKNGSEWTKIHKPVDIVEIITKCDDFDEDKYVKIYMAKYGVHNVRGGSYSKINLSHSSIIFLTQELRGSTDLCFGCGDDNHFIKKCPYLVQNISSKPTKRKCSVCGEFGHDKRKCEEKNTSSCLVCGEIGHNKHKCEEKNISPDPKKRKCSVCGEFGHDKRKCESKNISSNLSELPVGYIKIPKCRRCGRTGHNNKKCFAKTKLSGECIKISKCGRCGRMGHNKRKCFAKTNIKGNII